MNAEDAAYAERVRTARLEAIAVVRAYMNGNTDEVLLISGSSDDPCALARAAAGMAASLLMDAPPEDWKAQLDVWTAAAVSPAGNRPG